MKILGYVVIGIGCLACLTVIFIIPGAVLVGLGALLVIGSKHVSPAVNRVIAFCACAPLAVLVLSSVLGFMMHREQRAIEAERKSPAAQLTVTKKDQALQRSRFKECDYTIPGSSVRKICEEQAAAKRKPKISEN